MPKTENIVKFLQTAYTDERLAALLAHAQDGKLGYASCCCLIGIPTSDHALQEAPGIAYLKVNTSHYLSAKMIPLAFEAEDEFMKLGGPGIEYGSDELRCSVLIPLILAEQERREHMHLEEIDAEAEQNAADTSGYPDPAYEVLR